LGYSHKFPVIALVTRNKNITKMIASSNKNIERGTIRFEALDKPYSAE
jgi:hypothetical protein